MLCRNTFIFDEFILYVLDIDITRTGNNLKLKVKSEYSLIKYGLNADKP